jgi:hypothetical protein
MNSLFLTREMGFKLFRNCRCRDDDKMINEYGSVGVMRNRRSNRNTRIAPSLVTIILKQIPYKLAWVEQGRLDV